MIRTANSNGYDLICEARLVRLNPNVPTKTRGNAALVARFGHGRGIPKVVGSLPEGPILSYPTGTDLTEPERLRLADDLWATVQATSSISDPGTDPALLMVRHRPPAALYWEAVRRMVTLEEVRHWLERADPIVRSVPSGVGQIGAAAALAWPGGHPTWEAIAYRAPQRWGLPRRVNRESVYAALARHPELFLCVDPRTRRVLIAPHTACPILFGLRATDPSAAVAALQEIRSERIARWLLFRTNQGTGDHVRRPWALPPEPFASGTLTGRLVESPRPRRGGHILFTLELETGARVPCAVFEPTKTLPRVIRSLIPGDRLRLWGGSQGDPMFRVEGVELLTLRPREVLQQNPRCRHCSSRMGSLGAGRGFRCPRCRHRLPPEARRTKRVSPEFPVGRYHPTPSARRHLAPRGPEPGIPPGSMR
jgi:tRNA(Ile2)-agmatinylcytidine synthase